MTTEPNSRWTLVTRLINTWWPPLHEQDGVSGIELAHVEQRVQFPLPQALSEWYLRAGNRQDFIGNQDYLVPVDELTVVDDVLIFCIENQAVVRWGVRRRDTHVADPPVFMETYTSEGQQVRIPHTSSVSAFLLEMVVLATTLSGKFVGYGPASDELLWRVVQHYTAVPQNTSKLLLFSDDDTLLVVQPLVQPDMLREDGQLAVAARHRVAFARFVELVGEDWGTLNHWGEWGAHLYTSSCQDVPPPFIIRSPLPAWLNVSDDDFPICHLTSDGPKMSSYRHNENTS